MENITKTTHPLILVAAASVTIASLAAAAHFTGLLPTRSSEIPAAPTAAITAPDPASIPAPATAQPVPAAKTEQTASETRRVVAKPRIQRQAAVAGTADRRSDEDGRHGAGTQRVAANDAGIDIIPAPPTPAAAPVPAVAPPICRECGTVEGVRGVATQGEGSALGAIAGGVLGGVLGHQVGHGSGKDLATIAGAVGGAFAGHEVEKNVRTAKQYQVEVRFDDGSLRSYTLPTAAWRRGDRVRLSNGNLVAIPNSDR